MTGGRSLVDDLRRYAALTIAAAWIGCRSGLTMTIRARPIEPTVGDQFSASSIQSTADDQRSRLEGHYRRNARWLLGVVRRQLGHQPGDAEDIVHDTYVRASRYSEDALARHPRALLKQIAVNLARDHMRRNVVRGGAPIELDDQASRHHCQLSIEPDQQHLITLKHAILALPERLREVFVLSRFTSMTNVEIASHFGISVKSVEWRMAQALQRCASYMRD